jgi:hypothetical protein
MDMWERMVQPAQLVQLALKALKDHREQLGQLDHTQDMPSCSLIAQPPLQEILALVLCDSVVHGMIKLLVASPFTLMLMMRMVEKAVDGLMEC